MPVIAVANPQGGTGKSTLATQLAGALAAQGHAAMLGDLGRQQPARQWLALRELDWVPIRGWEIREGSEVVRPPKGTTHVVIDTPSGLQGPRLDGLMKQADLLIIPLPACRFDLQATRAFLTELCAHPRADRVRLALVGVGVKAQTVSAARLRQLVTGLPVPLVTALRDTPSYSDMMARGMTLWDPMPRRVERDLAQWAPLLRWMEQP